MRHAMRSLDIPPFETRWTDVRFAVLDVESNGQQPPELVELGLVPIEAGVAGDPVSWLVRPVRPVSFRVASIHGLQNADLSDAPRLDDVRSAILSALRGRYIIAHNAGVDWSILHRAIPELEVPGVIDTLRLARAVAPGLPSYRLADLLRSLGLLCNQLGPAHRAAHDALGAMCLFRCLMERHARGTITLAELLSLGRLRTANAPLQPSLF
jgi:DNA polymerase III epsilon subunit-like protein